LTGVTEVELTVTTLNLLVRDAGKAAQAGLNARNGCMKMQPFFCLSLLLFFQRLSFF
jgi:hypothetical protein